MVERYDIHNASTPPTHAVEQAIVRSDFADGCSDRRCFGAAAWREQPADQREARSRRTEGPLLASTFRSSRTKAAKARSSRFSTICRIPTINIRFITVLTLPADTLWVVLPKSMTFTGGSGSSFESVAAGSDRADLSDAQRRRPEKPSNFRSPAQARFRAKTRTGKAARTRRQRPGRGCRNQPGGGIGEPINTPDPLSKYKWWILGGLGLLLAAAAAFLLRRPADRRRRRRQQVPLPLCLPVSLRRARPSSQPRKMLRS